MVKSDSHETFGLMTLFCNSFVASVASRRATEWDSHPLEIAGFHGAQFFGPTGDGAFQGALCGISGHRKWVETGDNDAE